MRLILNLIWLVLSGFWLFLLYGVIALLPFGRDVDDADDVDQAITAFRGPA